MFQKEFPFNYFVMLAVRWLLLVIHGITDLSHSFCLCHSAVATLMNAVTEPQLNFTLQPYLWLVRWNEHSARCAQTQTHLSQGAWRSPEGHVCLETGSSGPPGDEEIMQSLYFRERWCTVCLVKVFMSVQTLIFCHITITKLAVFLEVLCVGPTQNSARW